MIDIVNRFFGKTVSDGGRQATPGAGHDIRLAACALFLEMARIDGSFTEDETREILSILEGRYGLSADDAGELMAAADKELNDSVDLWQFARLINENYTNDEKLEIIEMLWRIVYVDGRLDQHENYLMHKLEQLLRLSHKQLIDMKLKVLHGQ
ncbi:hypothetical protein D3OALGB2SA_3637 [Olavius algarvensis associated proteobacterium Delta 3]|nr:hypothetical protein D3OALGB2SA_3637 [Olavius algarvensis associated proteobacterium Delta 3]